jgi:hypothetical protein
MDLTERALQSASSKPAFAGRAPAVGFTLQQSDSRVGMPPLPVVSCCSALSFHPFHSLQFSNLATLYLGAGFESMSDELYGGGRVQDPFQASNLRRLNGFPGERW